MNKVSLEMSIVADTDGKTLLKTKVPLESLNTLIKTKGEAEVQKFIWEMFSRLTREIAKQ